jgi:hypothetical protein
MPRRFRQWLVFVLTLSVLLASNAIRPTRSFCDSGSDPVSVVDNEGSSSSPAGDPDGPSGPTKRSTVPGRGSRSVVRTVTVVARGGMSVWIWRVQVVLQSLRIRG